MLIEIFRRFLAVERVLAIHWIPGECNLNSKSFSFVALDKSNGGGSLRAAGQIGSGKILTNSRN